MLSASASAAVTIRVDAGKPHQTMEGFGATTTSLAYGAKDNVPAALRAKAIQAAYGDVHLNMGNLNIEPFEASPSNVFAPANDDGDPNNLNANGFNWIQSDNMFNKVVTPGKQYGFDDYWLGPVVSTGFSLAWVNALRSSNYGAYLDEIAEHVLAVVSHWRDAYGVTPRYLQLWNEPLSGNGELSGGSPQELVDIVKRTGARLKAAGFSMRFVVPAEETESISLGHASMILADAIARPFVGAIAYHPYPYGSTYASVPNILSTSGSGTPQPAAVKVRNDLRDLGAGYGVPVFMVEVSHSELSFDDFDGVRGRAIQIHDELEYANASAFFGMNALWDSTSHAEHFSGRADPGFYSETDTIVLIDNGLGVVRISPMGHAIGHYARAIRRGAVRLDATSDDALVQVTAFRDAAQGRFVLVAINNAGAARQLDVALAGLSVSGSLSGEQSTASAVWAKLTDVPVPQGTLSLSAPAKSVTTWWAPLAGAVVPDAGTSAGGAPGAGGGSASGGQAGSTGGGSGSGAGGGNAAGGTAGGGGALTGTAGGAGEVSRPDASAASSSGGGGPTASRDSSGCGCRTSGAGSPKHGLVAALGLALLLRRRRNTSA